MGKRFYCDYCDKSFPDNPTNRRNHLQGLQHQQARKLHYDAYLDPIDKLAIERNKKPCVLFRRNGTCNFGPLCRYSHLTPIELQNLEAEAKLQHNSRESMTQLASPENIAKQLELFESRIRTRLSQLSNSAERHFKIPDGYSDVVLPPSLLLSPSISNAPISSEKK